MTTTPQTEADLPGDTGLPSGHLDGETTAEAQALADSVSDASLRRSQARSVEIEEQIATDPSGFRMLTGDRPTGNLHLGHYIGTLANRVRLQNLGLDTFVVIADYQVITDCDSVGEMK